MRIFGESLSGSSGAGGGTTGSDPSTETTAVAHGAAGNQYAEGQVIGESIPNKGKLANTGGMPLVGVAFLALALVGLGISVLRFAIRRER